MKIEYIRNMQFGYMRMEMEKPLSKTEEEMLTHNQIEGLLPVRWQKENDRYLLRYDITGKQALDGLLENVLVDENLLKSLLVGIYVAVKQLEKYLLPQEGLLLLPEAIFWDYKTETMHFCYFPEGEEPLQERFKKLMEYMLAKTDHKNILAVQLAYGVYEEVQKSFFCMEDLQNYLQGQCASMHAEEKIDSVEDTWEAEKCCQKESGVENDGSNKYVYKLGWTRKILAWIKDNIKRFTKDKKVEEVVIFDVEKCVGEEMATTILGGRQDEIEGFLKYEGMNSLPDIRVTKVPFVIGSANNCEGVLRHPNISRAHAKITCRDNTYFIEDLNSTNGTRVNDGLLSYKTKVSLKKNTDIYFANEHYRFL